MNLIPNMPGKSPNAWCTWATQNLTIDSEKSKMSIPLFAGDQGVKAGRNNLNEAVLFGPRGWAHDWPTIRQDLYLLLDDGWDVGYGIHPDKSMADFGSMELDKTRFPSCHGSPPERLKKLNNLVKAAGWRGAGLWIAAQAQGDTYGNKMDDAALKDYWQQRLEWSRYAGIEYWKVDWGVRGNDLAFRELLTQLGKEIAPDLLIEHSIGLCPLNGITLNNDGGIEGSGCFSDMSQEEQQKFINLLKYSQFTRIYDTVSPMTTVTSFERTAFFLKTGNPIGHGYVNVEDEVYLGASLGCAIGVMRSPLWTSLEYDMIAKRARRTAEVVRAVRWQRLAPAFKLGTTTVQISSEILKDEWRFPENSTWWAAIYHKTVNQSAPAAIARGLELPEVRGHQKPFVGISLNPNGAITVAALPRISSPKGLYTPLTDVFVNHDCLNRHIGIFGSFKSLSFVLAQGLTGKRVMAQDLATDEACEITDSVVFSDGILTIPHEVIEVIGKQAGEPESAPGMMLRVE